MNIRMSAILYSGKEDRVPEDMGTGVYNIWTLDFWVGFRKDDKYLSAVDNLSLR